MRRRFLPLLLLLFLALGTNFALLGCGGQEKNTPPENSYENEEDAPASGGAQAIVDEEEEAAGYHSVSYKVRAGEKYSPEAGYTPLQIFGRLNWTFRQKTDWYAQYEGTVDTVLKQDVKTFKQFHDGILISADISTSALLNTAREFCYDLSSNRVVWREASKNPKKYDGFKTPWKQELAGDMAIEGEDAFKETRGLPAYELSVYVFREETILRAEPVTQNEDGTFSITYHLAPEVRETKEGSSEGATAYYGKQMMFSGGLGKEPTFHEISVTFTFNETWETIFTEIFEKYTTYAGFMNAECEGKSKTSYFYDKTNPPFEECGDFEAFFKEKLR